MNFTIYSFPPIICILLTSFILYLVFRFSQDNLFKKICTQFCGSVILWQFLWVFLFACKNETLAIFLARLGYTNIVFLPSFTAQFTFYSYFKRTSRFLNSIIYLSFVFIFLIWFTDYFVKGVHHFYFGYYPDCRTPGHFIYLMLMIIQIFYVFYTFFKSEKSPRVKPCIISFIVFIFSSLDFAVNWGLEIYPYGFIFTLISTINILYFIIFKTYSGISILNEKLNVLLSEKTNQLNLLLSALTHDIKNRILNTSLGIDCLLKSKDTDLSILKEYKKQLDIAYYFTVNLLNITENESHGIVFHKSNIDLKVWLTTLCEKTYSDLITKKQMILNLEEMPVNIDLTYMELVINNLISNAIQYSCENAIIQVIVKNHADFCFLSIRNRGPLIDASDQSHLFEKYNNKTKHSAYSKGLGLYFSKIVIEKHGGDIEYIAQENESINEFRIKLPSGDLTPL